MTNRLNGGAIEPAPAKHSAIEIQWASGINSLTDRWSDLEVFAILPIRRQKPVSIIDLSGVALSKVLNVVMSVSLMLAG